MVSLLMKNIFIINYLAFNDKKKKRNFHALKF